MKAGKTVLSAILALTLFLTSLLGGAMLLAQNALAALPTLAARLVDEDFVSQTELAVQSRVTQALSLLPISYDSFSDLLNRELLARETQKAADATLRALTGEAEAAYCFENEALRQRIVSLLEQSAQTQGVIYEESAAQEVYEAVCARVEGGISFSAEAYAAKVAPYLTALEGILRFWFAPMLVAAFCALALFLLHWHRKRKGGFYILSPLYFAALSLFALSFVLYRRDLLAQTVLTDRVLQCFLRRLYLVLLGDVWRSVLPVMVALALAILVLIGVCVCKAEAKHAN